MAEPMAFATDHSMVWPMAWPPALQQTIVWFDVSNWLGAYIKAYCQALQQETRGLSTSSHLGVLAGMQWLLTSYSSPHPSLSGHPLVVLPHMGYVMCNGQVWSHLDHREFDQTTLSKLTSLNHTLYEEVVNKKREVFLVNAPFGTPGRLSERRRIGIHRLYCDIDSLWYIETKDYDSESGRYYWNPCQKSGTFNFQIEKCTEMIALCVQRIQKLFRHRQWLRSYPTQVRYIRHIKTFRNYASHLPCDVIDNIERQLLRPDLFQRKKDRPMITVETELLKDFLRRKVHI
jgi:hypothetical protein